jgi:hypothetical protein
MNKRNRNDLLSTINGRRPSSKPYTGRLEKACKDLSGQVEKLLDERRALRVMVAKHVRNVQTMEDLVEGLNPKAQAELERLIGAASNDE